MYDIIEVISRIGKIREVVEEINKYQGIMPDALPPIINGFLGREGTVEEITQMLNTELANYRNLVDTRYSFLLGQELTRRETLAKNKTFTVYWRDGSRRVIHGPTIDKAFTAHGYGAGALKGMDFYMYGDCKDYQWSSDKKEWLKIKDEVTHG